MLHITELNHLSLNISNFLSKLKGGDADMDRISPGYLLFYQMGNYKCLKPKIVLEMLRSVTMKSVKCPK